MESTIFGTNEFDPTPEGIIHQDLTVHTILAASLTPILGSSSSWGEAESEEDEKARKKRNRDRPVPDILNDLCWYYNMCAQVSLLSEF